MSYHIVEVCDRCGSRNMSPGITPEMAPDFGVALIALVDANDGPNGSAAQGCQECNPEVVRPRRSQTEGRLRAIWDGKAGS